MPKYTQADRPMAVATPLGADVLLLQEVSGTEAISRPFQFRLELLAESSSEVAFDQLLGQSVTVEPPSCPTVETLHQRHRQHVQPGPSRSPSPQGSNFFNPLPGRDRPQGLWLLTRNGPEPDLPADDRPRHPQAGPHRARRRLPAPGDLRAPRLLRPVPRDRLRLRQPAHGRRRDLLLLQPRRRRPHDGRGRHAAEPPRRARADHGRSTRCRGRASARRTGSRPGRRARSSARASTRSGTTASSCPASTSRPTRPILDTRPGRDASPTSSRSAATTSWSSTTTPAATPSGSTASTPGGGDRAGDIQNIFEDNARTVGIRMQEETAPASRSRGAGTCRQFVAGYKFTLDRHFNANGAYVLTRVAHLGHAWATTYTGGTDASSIYQNTFTCIPAALPFRPARTTPRPVVQGTQTAVVVGARARRSSPTSTAG